MNSEESKIKLDFLFFLHVTTQHTVRPQDHDVHVEQTKTMSRMKPWSSRFMFMIYIEQNSDFGKRRLNKCKDVGSVREVCVICATENDFERRFIFLF